MKNGLVSIIIPTYNRAHLVATAIRSALAQDYPHKQLIVVDDGSTDATRQLVSTFAEVEYYYQPNKGQAAARNTGLRYSRGEYIASLDSDDVWDPHFLTVGIERLHQYEASFVFLNWRGSEDESDLDYFCRQPEARSYLTQADGDWWLLTPAQTRQLVMETCPAPSSAIIMRRAAMPGCWNEQMWIADDWCLLMGLVLAQPSVAAFTLRPHWLKRIDGQNIYDGRDFLTITRELFFHDEVLMFQHYKHELRPAEQQLFRQRQAKYHYDYATVGTRHQLGVPTALGHMVLAFWLWPRGLGQRLARFLTTYFKNR